MRDKAFKTAKNTKNNGYQRGLASMVYKVFDKKYALLSWAETLSRWDKFASGGAVKN